MYFLLLGLPCGSDDKEPDCNVGDLGLIPGLGRSLEKEMATHLSILARRIPWTEEIGGLQSKGSKGVLNLKVRNLKLKVSFNSLTMNCSMSPK